MCEKCEKWALVMNNLREILATKEPVVRIAPSGQPERDSNLRFQIVSDYVTLIWENCPILYVGKNASGDWIIGSSTDEDDNERMEYFVHALVPDTTMKEFWAGRKSLLSVWQTTSHLCVVKKSYDATKFSYYNVECFEIPSEYHPLGDSYVPDYSQKELP